MHHGIKRGRMKIEKTWVSTYIHNPSKENGEACLWVFGRGISSAEACLFWTSSQVRRHQPWEYSQRSHFPLGLRVRHLKVSVWMDLERTLHRGIPVLGPLEQYVLPLIHPESAHIPPAFKTLSIQPRTAKSPCQPIVWLHSSSRTIPACRT